MMDYDSGDLDAVVELDHSPGYVLVTKRIREMIERKRTELEGIGWDQCLTEAARGYVKALREVLTIPDVLRSEIQGQIQKQKR